MYSSYNENRIDYLGAKIAEVMFDPEKRRDLDNLALEILIERERLESVLESDASEPEKEKAKIELKKLRDVEKSIVRIYFLTIISGKDENNPFMNYIMSKYSRSGGIKRVTRF